MAKILYKKQTQILHYLRQYIEANGTAPTLRQIADVMGVSSLATVHEHLQTLEAKGVIKRIGKPAKSIEFLDKTLINDTGGLNVPIMGIIAAGAPIDTYTDPNATINIPSTFFNPQKRTYVLKVKGESMIEDGILNDDYVVIESTDTAKDGEIVVALLETGLATLKRFFKEATRIRLEPANARMAPIYAKNIRIQGKVVGLIRHFS